MKNIIFVLLCVSISLPTKAELVNLGDVTRDTLTGLDWLDLNLTVGQDYQSVLASDYVQNQGYRYASLEEVQTLWLNAGAAGTLWYDPVEADSILSSNYVAAINLVFLMGCTSTEYGIPCDGTEQNWHAGMYGNIPPNNSIKNAAIVDYFGAGDYRSGRAAMWLDWGYHVEDLESRIDVGSYLVRAAPVPIPAAIYFLGSALVAFTVIKNRAKIFGRAQ